MSLRRDTGTTPLLAWRESELATLASVLGDAISAWQQEWGLSPQPRATCAAATRSDAEAASWTCIAAAAPARVWMATEAGLAERLAQALFATGTTTPLLLELGAACRCDLLQRLAGALGAGDASAVEARAAPVCGCWSGAVRVNLSPWPALLIEGSVLVSLLRAGGTTQSAARVARVGPALVPLARAVASRGVDLQVRLQGCELDLGSLQDLQPGDVVRLRHRVDAPAGVYGPDGQPLFNAFLARSRGRKAVELASLPGA